MNNRRHYRQVKTRLKELAFQHPGKVFDYVSRMKPVDVLGNEILMCLLREAKQGFKEKTFRMRVREELIADLHSNFGTLVTP